jgi:peptidyl-prolyl cis-trans isomerase-like 2
LKPNFLKDLLNDVPFSRKDIITIQDPSNLSKFNINDFFYLKKKLKWTESDIEERKKSDYYLKTINTEAKNTLDELNKTYEPSAATKAMSSSNYKLSSTDQLADNVNAASYSTGRVAASFTSTVMEVCTTQLPAIIDENEIRWSRLLKSGKKGYVCLVTNMGRLNIELFCDQVPRVCENFLKLCAKKYYKDTIFHRSIRNFMIQGGDPTGSGTGGQSVRVFCFCLTNI